MWRIGQSEYPQLATVWNVEDKGNYSVVKLSTARKNKDSGEYINSSWSFVRFLGRAHEKVNELSERDRIVILAGSISLEPYIDKEGNKAWPKNPQILVFDWEFSERKTGVKNSTRNLANDLSLNDEGDIPF